MIDNVTQQVEVVERVVAAIKPQLAGLGPHAQGAILAELLSVWLAGMPPQMRKQMLTMHVASVRNLVSSSERELFGPLGHPAGR